MQCIGYLNIDLSTVRYMVTTSVKPEIHIWDARNLGEQVHSLHSPYNVSNISLSQTGMLALATNNYVKVG